MTRWVVGALFFCVSLDLLACPLCMGGGVPTSAQMLDTLGEAVLAVPTAEENGFRVVAVISYSALLAAKPRLSAHAIRQWLADPRLAERQPLYLLLLGIAGNAEDAAALEQRLESAWEAGEATNLGPMIVADLQLRGPSRLAWVDDRYLRDRRRSTREIEATLLALGVHGHANGAIPRRG